MCSGNEAFGRVTVEAMKLGVPVIGAKSGGTLDIIIENENGLFYESGNSQHLSERLFELINNKELYNFLSKNAIRGANELYNNDNHTNNLMKIFKNL